MKLIIPSIKVRIEEDRLDTYLDHAAVFLHLEKSRLSFHSILSKSIDIRDKNQFYYKLILVVEVPDGYANKKRFEEYSEDKAYLRRNPVRTDKRPIVIGFGPAGMFASLELLNNGLKPIIFERGKKVEERTEDVKRFIKTRQLNAESNIQFGEGGAGTYSDGKLFSRRNKNQGVVSRFFDYLIEFGAPSQIGYVEKPHLGTDVLRRIVKNIREYIILHGGEIHYESKLTDIVICGSTVEAVIINDRDEYKSDSVFLATGHSARDTYSMLYKKGVGLEARKIMIGVRVEHPAELINEFRYGPKYASSKLLLSATYSLNYTDKKAQTGAYTFCMCPGGEVVNASSESGYHVVNGMSYSTRSLPYSNAAVVVPCPVTMFDSENPLAGLEFQKSIERKTYNLAGDWRAPAISLTDFMHGRRSNSCDLGGTSFQMGLLEAHPDQYLPAHVTDQLKNAFFAWEKLYPEYITDRALLIGAETRTSSPVRIMRKKNFQSVSIENLYPIGEGAGYTGGITSSAADGIRAVDAFIEQLA